MRSARSSVGALLHGTVLDRLLRAATLRNLRTQKWPTEEVDARLRPTDPQRSSLVALQDASAKAADMLKTSCQADDEITPPARLVVVGKRLETMSQGVKLVRSALDDFYGKLSDEQKAQYEANGPGASSLVGSARHDAEK